MGITNFLDKPVSKDKLEAFLKEKNFIWVVAKFNSSYSLFYI